MRRSFIACCLVAMVAASVPAATPAELFDAATLQFAANIDTPSLGMLAVQYGGRVAILDTLARQQLLRIYGTERIDGTDPAFGYLELYFNAGAYLDRPVVFVRSAKMRKLLVPYLDRARTEQFARTGRLPPLALLSGDAQEHLLWAGRATEGDLARTGPVGSLAEALSELGRDRENRLLLERLQGRTESFLALGVLRLLPRQRRSWLGPDHLRALASDPELSEAITPAGWVLAGKIEHLAAAWRACDAKGVNALILKIAELAAAEGAGEYPSGAFRRLELLYNRTAGGTIVFVGYAAALVVMIIAVSGRMRWPRRVGLGLFAFSTLLLLAGFVARWVLSARSWYLPPMTNQFEAVVASALLGALIALVLELVWRRDWFVLSASLYATLCLLAGLILPERMGATISAPGGILNSSIMAAHVAVIIVAHAMVGMTFVISVIYLVAAAIGGAGMSGVASADRCNLITAQIACWTLCAGTALGAFWADRAWGRWWGWDVKETWALITCLIYVAIIHLRFIVPARRRGVVTALGCIVGTAAMLFNWIVVNYLLPSLHGYA